MMDEQPPSKRQKLGSPAGPDPSTIRERRAGFLNSLSRSISPPAASIMQKSGERSYPAPKKTNSTTARDKNDPAGGLLPDGSEARNLRPASPAKKPNMIPSPVTLTQIRDLPTSSNIDAVSLRDIIGDPLIKEAWIFNFCFDVDWMMQHFDSDVRSLVKVKIIHGSWRREDMNKIEIDDACNRLPNVEAIQAYLPDAFGTHHSKMFILFRHDDTAQLVIHTANMLAKDWTNMTQAVWKTSHLPLLNKDIKKNGAIGSGGRFCHDLTRYLKAYGAKLKPLVQQLQLYDFTKVRAGLIASVPSKFKACASDEEVWGHLALRNTLQALFEAQKKVSSSSHLICQVSSIASLPGSWLQETLLSAASPPGRKLGHSIIYPTAADVAVSLDGYAAGGSIHTKAQSATHLKQIQSLQPALCRWTQGSLSNTRAGRHLAAPHIKTYITFESKPTLENPAPNIDWVLVTSANLSTQAWGSAPKLPKGTKDPAEAIVHIQSFEIGVLLWPEMYKEQPENQMDIVKFVPVFKRDDPVTDQEEVTKQEPETGTVVGIRMPYDLPLTPYITDELPWSPQSTYQMPDRHGRTWPPGVGW